MKTPEEFLKGTVIKALVNGIDVTLEPSPEMYQLIQAYSDYVNKLLTLKLAEAEHAAQLNKEWAEGYEKQLKEQRTVDVIELLKVAKCPNANCDNKGTIAHQISVDEFEAEPCEWCFHRDTLINLQQKKGEQE